MNRNLTRWLKILIFPVVVLSVVLIWGASLLDSMADVLEAKEIIKSADVLIVLGGEHNGERTRRAIEIYKQDYAGRILFSDGTNLSWRTKAVDEMTALASSLDVPQDSIFTEESSKSTYENAIFTKEILEEKGWKSAIVVTTYWHTRRVKMIFDHVYKDSGISLSYAPAREQSNDNLHGWWKDSEDQQTVLTEWAKLGVYWLKYIIF